MGDFFIQTQRPDGATEQPNPEWIPVVACAPAVGMPGSIVLRTPTQFVLLFDLAVLGSLGYWDLHAKLEDPQ